MSTLKELRTLPLGAGLSHTIRLFHRQRLELEVRGNFVRRVQEYPTYIDPVLRHHLGLDPPQNSNPMSLKPPRIEITHYGEKMVITTNRHGDSAPSRPVRSATSAAPPPSRPPAPNPRALLRQQLGLDTIGTSKTKPGK